MKRIILAILLFLFFSAASLASERVVMVGDSLTCGYFGDNMELFLNKTYGKENVHVLGSCGSSPEAWTPGMKSYRSRCGTRHLEEFKGVAPKLDVVIAKWKPTILVVQLGTNHFDAVKQSGDTIFPHLRYVYGKFLDSAPKLKIVWITPPDSSKFSDKVTNGVCDQIITACKKRDVFVIHSDNFTTYSGSDGVHYGPKGAAKWSSGVIERWPLVMKAL